MWYSTSRCLTEKWATSQRVGEESGVAGTPADGRSPERTQSWSEAKGQEGKGRTQKAMKNRLLKWSQGLDKREVLWYDNIPLETGELRDLNN